MAMHSMLINKPPDTGSMTSRHPMHQVNNVVFTRAVLNVNTEELTSYVFVMRRTRRNAILSKIWFSLI